MCVNTCRVCSEPAKFAEDECFTSLLNLHNRHIFKKQRFTNVLIFSKNQRMLFKPNDIKFTFGIFYDLIHLARQRKERDGLRLSSAMLKIQ